MNLLQLWNSCLSQFPVWRWVCYLHILYTNILANKFVWLHLKIRPSYCYFMRLWLNLGLKTIPQHSGTWPFLWKTKIHNSTNKFSLTPFIDGCIFISLVYHWPPSDNIVSHTPPTSWDVYIIWMGVCMDCHCALDCILIPMISVQSNPGAAVNRELLTIAQLTSTPG